MSGFRIGLLALALIVSLVRAPQAARAQSSPAAATAILTGTIRDDQQRPVANALVRVSGAASGLLSTSTSSDGSFTVRGLAAGLYRLEVIKSGFTSATQDDVVLVAQDKTDVRVTLQPASFSSLRTIGRVTVAARGKSSINTSTASIADVSGDTFIEQGQLSVTRVLNELPGMTLGPTTGFGSNTSFLTNASSPLATGVPSIRGALPYETASLVDGHPIAIGVAGTFNPVFISPYVLQDVEIVKGPGATAPNINYAIGGTENFRTLEPTRVRRQSADFGTDEFGGSFANFRATGSVPGGHLSYAFDYATQGTQGYDRNFTQAVGTLYFPGSTTTINRVPICLNPATGACTFTAGPGDPRYLSSTAYGSSLIACCPALPMSSNERNELTKLRYAFTPSTALTVTYLGGQSRGAAIGGELYTLPGDTFTPPAGYTGSFPAGATLPFNIATGIGSQAETNANLFQTELRTAVGRNLTVLARQYTATVQTFFGGPGDVGPSPGTFSLGAQFFGGAPFNNDTAPTILNGTSGIISATDYYSATRSRDRLNGFTFEADQQAGDDLFSLSYDQVRTASFAEQEASLAFAAGVQLPDGTAQTFRTLMLRGQFELTPRVRLMVSDNLASYTDRYSQDGGTTFTDSTHAYNAPRLSLSWRPATALALRAATGFSLAPPYANLLTNSGLITPSNVVPPQYYTTTANSGDVRPETAFGFDLGFDARLPSFNVVSVDAYDTTLHDQFLQSTFTDGTYTPPAGEGLPLVPKPLYVTKTENLGHSRYKGVEIALHRAPLLGFGYTLAATLTRAYPYDLPAGFYDTAAGLNTTNLAVLPNINFQASGLSYNGLSSSRVPYSTGYVEFNRRFRNGAYVLAGVTYYGPNNSYNEPAFGVVNATFRQPLTRDSSLQLSIDNVTGAYDKIYYDFYGTAVGTPLKNGLLGFTPANVIGPTTARLILHVAL